MTPPNSRAEKLQALIDHIVDTDPQVPGVILTVEAEGLSFASAAGSFAIDGRELAPTDLFRAASITKTFTAAAVMVLVERGELRLTDPIANWLAPGTVAVLEGGGYDPSAITVRQLLDHTAGIFDYTEADAYYAAIRANPKRVWTRAEQVQLAMDEGEPLNEPGAAFHYGDTHYILAGEILERRTGKSLAAALRTLLQYDKFGLANTWLETLEPAPRADAEAHITHPYIGDEDTRGWHASWDLFGGGGLVTSTADMLRFIGALFDTQRGIFARPETLATMLAVSDVGAEAFFGMDGAMGIGRFELDGGGTCYAGFGFFSTMLVICPGAFSFAATENQAEPAHPDALLDGVLEILAGDG